MTEAQKHDCLKLFSYSKLGNISRYVRIVTSENRGVNPDSKHRHLIRLVPTHPISQNVIYLMERVKAKHPNIDVYLSDELGGCLLFI